MMRVAWLVVVAGLAPSVSRRGRPVLYAAWVAVLSPVLAVLVFASIVFSGVIRRRSHRRRLARLVDGELPLLGDLVALGLTGGASFAGAMADAARHLRSPLAAEVREILRRSHRNGSAMVLEGGSGAAGRLYRLAGRALVTGAPLAAAVEAFSDELREERRAKRLAEARRLPVLLMFPLALLLLPGFVLLTVAPAVVGALERVAL